MITLKHSPVNSDPEIMGGTLVFRNTRVPVQTILDYLDDGYTLEEFLDNFPSVERLDAIDFLKLARGRKAYIQIFLRVEAQLEDLE